MNTETLQESTTAKAASTPVYFHREAEQITPAQVEAALVAIGDKYPTANKSILFTAAGQRTEERPIDFVRNGDGEHFVNAVRHCVDWLTHFNLAGTTRKTVNRRRAAYGYKHAVERWVSNVKNAQCNGSMNSYTPMLAFIVAAWLMGIPETIIAGAGSNPYYPLSEKDYKHADAVATYQRAGLRVSRGTLAKAAENGVKLAALVERFGRIDALHLETSPDCSWWRALSQNQRIWAMDSFDRWAANSDKGIRASYAGAWVIERGEPSRNTVGEL